MKHSGKAALAGFTLVELLTVIGIIGVIAGFILAVAGPGKRWRYIYNTQAEMAQLETAIERYHATYGFYPPSPANPPVAGNPATLVNQLYYELVGTMLVTNSGVLYYTTLDGSAPIKVTDVPIVFLGVNGFVNCNQPGKGEESAKARNFLTDLKPNQKGTWTTGGGVAVTNLVGSVRGPDTSYMPLGSAYPDLNPWLYNSSHPAKNSGSYDLWIQLSIGGKINLVCNWTKQVQTQ